MFHTLRLLVLVFVAQIEQIWPIPTGPVDFHSEHARDVLRLAKSAEMRNFMNEALNPCEHFYRFACGNWPILNPAHKEYQTGIFSVLTKAYDRRLQRLLNAAKRSDESSMERKAKYFYESCVNRETTQSQYRHKLLGVVEEFGGMPMLNKTEWQEQKFDWLETTALILRRYGLQTVLSVEARADLMNNKINRLYVGQNDALTPSKASEYYAQQMLLWQMELQRTLGVSLNVAAKTAIEMVNFERKLAQGMADPFEGLGIEDITRLRLLEDMTESYRPAIDFVSFVRLWLGYEYRLPVYEYVESYQKNLYKIMQETPRHVVANYVLWMLLQEFRWERADSLEKQRKQCVERTKRFFIKYLDKMVYDDLLSESNATRLPNDVFELWTDLKRTFQLILHSNATNWMTNATRVNALAKLASMTMQINSYENEDFEGEFGGLVIRTDDYFQNVVRLLEMEGRNKRRKIQQPPKYEESRTLSYTPAYMPELNRVSLPVSFVQPRYLWDDSYPKALKFATVGYIVAHELIHGFDDSIRKYDAQGNLNNWWDKQSSEGFAKRKECLRQQYGEFRYFGKKLRLINSQDENIADNAGLRIAYYAYERWLHINAANKTLIQHEFLPHMNYKPNQLFFIAAAQLWCTDIKRPYRRLLLKTDVHAPEEIRVIAMLSNFDEFSRAFQCEGGSKMNPRQKCILY